MKKITVYELICLATLVAALTLHNIVSVPDWYIGRLLFAKCAYIGGIGGVLYCLRAIYLNKCARKQWDADWEIWYYIRPITSSISGFVSCIFLKAGLLVLDASTTSGSTPFGYLAIAFIAGYNVDNFMKRLEQLAETTWGVKRSRSGQQDQTAEEEITNG